MESEMASNSKDVKILWGLAKQYIELAAKPIQEEQRKLWSAHFSLKKTRIPVLVEYGMHNVWCREVFGDAAMECEDLFYREHERWLRMQIFHDTVDDDFILEPWITQCAVYKTPNGHFGEAWGAEYKYMQSVAEGGAYKPEPFIKNWEDVKKLTAPHHQVDEETTARDVQQLRDAIGDILKVNIDRHPVLNTMWSSTPMPARQSFPPHGR